MKPDWDKLMDAFADSTTALVADVDCTADGKPLCDANGDVLFIRGGREQHHQVGMYVVECFVWLYQKSLQL